MERGQVRSKTNLHCSVVTDGWISGGIHGLTQRVLGLGPNPSPPPSEHPPSSYPPAVHLCTSSAPSVRKKTH